MTLVHFGDISAVSEVLEMNCCKWIKLTILLTTELHLLTIELLLMC